MAVWTDSPTSSADALGGGREIAVGRPAGTAADLVYRAGAVLGTLGVALSLFVIARMFESWRVNAHMTSHQISVFGQRLTYPAANIGAIVVVALATIGLAVTVLLVIGAAREVLAARRFRRGIDAHGSEALRGALVVRDDRPRAFCAGLLRPRVYVSTGTLEMLDEAALNAVLLHERHHADRRDPLRLATGRVLARALFFIPGLGELVHRQVALSELSADETAVNGAPENRAALARAMLSFSDISGPGDSIGIDPGRVDYLLGEPPSWRFPSLLCLAAVSVIALLVATATLAGQVAAGSATLGPPFLSRQPCVVVLAMIPAALALLAVGLHRRRRRPPR